MTSSRSPRAPFLVPFPMLLAAAIGLALAVALPMAYAAPYGSGQSSDGECHPCIITPIDPVPPEPGAALGDEFPVNTHISGVQDTATIAMDAVGDFVIVWMDESGQDGSGSGIFAQRYNAGGTPAGDEFQVNTQMAGDQAFPTVAMDSGGDFVVAWTDRSGQDGDGFGVFAQRYNADGTPAGVEFRVNAITTGNQGAPAVAMNAQGDFVVAWQDDASHDGFSFGIFARRYNADGTPVGSGFQVNTQTDGDQAAPTIAMDAAGDFVVAWEDYPGHDGDLNGIFAQRFKADGSTNGGEFQVNTYTTGYQVAPAVAMDAFGNFVVAWTDYASPDDGHSRGIFAQRYKADGTVAGDEFQASANSDQWYPTVAMDAVGNFVVAWTDYLARDGDQRGVFAQSFKADGTPVGSAFQVNTEARSDQWRPAVAMSAAGNFVVAWTDWSAQDYSDASIFGQRYASDSSRDLESKLAVAPADPIEPGDDLTLTVTVINREKPVTAIGNTTIDTALTTATGLTATIALPRSASFHTPNSLITVGFPHNVKLNNATGTNWDCPTQPNSYGQLVCTYSKPLGAGDSTVSLVLDVTAPQDEENRKLLSLTFTSAATGDQPDVRVDNNSASVKSETSYEVTVNQPPVAMGSQVSMDENSEIEFKLRASDGDGDSLTYSIVDPPKHGQLSINDAYRGTPGHVGTYTYTPDMNYSGTDSFTFKAYDGELYSNTANVTITINRITLGEGDAGNGDDDDNSPGNGGSSASGGGGGLSWLGLELLALIALRRRRLGVK